MYKSIQPAQAVLRYYASEIAKLEPWQIQVMSEKEILELSRMTLVASNSIKNIILEVRKRNEEITLEKVKNQNV